MSFSVAPDRTATTEIDLSEVSMLATRPRLYAGNVPGASEEARRVKIINANWIADADGEDGTS
jgi:hypothetical protein